MEIYVLVDEGMNILKSPIDGKLVVLPSIDEVKKYMEDYSNPFIKHKVLKMVVEDVFEL